MTDYTRIDQLDRYPDIYVAPRLTQALARDGLIEPLVIREGQIIPEHQERFEAFCRIVDGLGEEGTPYVITVDWACLDANERAGL